MKKIIILFGIFILSTGAYASETWNGTEGELTNPILGGSELGNWGEPYDEHDIYWVDGNRSSGYLTEIWWVTATGEIGFTDAGWSRVPKADRSRIFRTEAEAGAMTQAFEQYKTDLASQAAEGEGEGETPEDGEIDTETGSERNGTEYVRPTEGTAAYVKQVSLHCAKDSEFDLTDVNKNDSLHDYLIRLNLDEEGRGKVKFFRYQHYPLAGPSGQSFRIPAGRFRKHEWMLLSQLCQKGAQFYCWDRVYDVYKVEWYLNRKTLELTNQTRWAGYNPNKERKAASCRVVKEDEFDSLDSQIVTFHKEFQERKAEKARKEAEEREEEYSI